MKKNILILAAHPDDETIGCGGVMHLLKKKYNIYVSFFTNGISARDSNNKKIKTRYSNLNKVKTFQGFKILEHLNFPDNQMDKVSLLEIVKKTESMILKVSPEIIFTHHENDLNIDHRCIHQATMVACRPMPQSKIKSVLSYEVNSSTNWVTKNTFEPNFYVNIEKYIKLKAKALKLYGDEMKPYPHSRSIKGIINNNIVRGNEVGLEYAEAFNIIRSVHKNGISSLL